MGRRPPDGPGYSYNSAQRTTCAPIAPGSWPPPLSRSSCARSPDYTWVEGVSDKSRHRLLGNGWHWGVAGRLLTILVLATVSPHADCQGALAGGCMASSRGMGAGCGDAAPRPTHDWLEPGLEHLLWVRGRWRHDVVRIRSSYARARRPGLERPGAPHQGGLHRAPTRTRPPRCRSCFPACWSSWATPTWRASRPTSPRAST